MRDYFAQEYFTFTMVTTRNRKRTEESNENKEQNLE
uniref:BMA-USP-39, isoform c n=1 Tax=Brugia malayi TaxID=6279 RepID=A0A0J9Y9W1_BRUMA|nr:BMA-USP-39, isoform c [Brugia malayi]